MDNSGKLYTATVIIDTILVIFALLMIFNSVLYMKAMKKHIVWLAALVTCIIYLLSWIMTGMSLTGIDAIEVVKKMDCFRYDDTDIIHQMAQQSKQRTPIFGLGIAFSMSSILFCVVPFLACHPSSDSPNISSNKEVQHCRFIKCCTVWMILAAIINICLTYWFMDFSNHSTFSDDWQLVLNSITNPQQNSTIQSCYAEGEGLPDAYFANMSYPSNPTVWKPTRTPYPTYAVPTKTPYPIYAITTKDPTTNAPHTNTPSLQPTVLVPTTNSPSIYVTLAPTAQPLTKHPTDTQTDEPSLHPTVNTTNSPTMHPATRHPTNAPTLHPSEASIEPTFSPTFSPTNDPTDATFAPTFNPTMDPTSPLIENVELEKECNFENRYCYDFALAQVDATKDVNCNEICENSNRIYKGVQVLFEVNLTNSIFEMLAFFVDLLLLIPWEKHESKMTIFLVLFISQIVLVFIDFILEIASGSIVIDYRLVHHLDELFANQCYSRYGDSTIIEMSSNVQQILYFSWGEAILSLCVLFFCYTKVKQFNDDVENRVPLTRKMFFISLFASLINLILACLTFFMFTMPTYLDYIQLYDSEQMSCWIQK